MNRWAKAVLIVAPLALGTSVYAFANDRSTIQSTIEIQEAQPVNQLNAGTPPASGLPDIPNPFVVHKDQIQQQTQTRSSLSTEQRLKLNMKVGKPKEQEKHQDRGKHKGFEKAEKSKQHEEKEDDHDED